MLMCELSANSLTGMEKMGDGSGFSVAVKEVLLLLYLNARSGSISYLEEDGSSKKGVNQEELIDPVVLCSIRNQKLKYIIFQF
uniref:Uncharacterized protein n=1 Tax=Noccaea caerulescens TaxID=107243 RepID=A0A1J3F9V0_NOCCA